MLLFALLRRDPRQQHVPGLHQLPGMTGYSLGLCKEPQFISRHGVLVFVRFNEGLERMVLRWRVPSTAAHGDWSSYKKRCRKENLALVSNEDLKF